MVFDSKAYDELYPREVETPKVNIEEDSVIDEPAEPEKPAKPEEPAEPDKPAEPEEPAGGAE